jgi:hypothetical protein
MSCHFCRTDHDFENPCQRMKDAMESLQARTAEHRRLSMEVPRIWPPLERTPLRWEAYGLSCAIVKGNFALCGYVHVPEGHPDANSFYDDVDVNVHGGLTFTCKAEGGGRWFGFDCGHFGDWWGYAENGHASEHPGKVWTVDDVKAETERLAKQLAKLATSTDVPKGQPEPPG